MRVAFVMNLAPRKLGSLEDWVLALCREARWRGHAPSVFSRTPVHPSFAGALGAIDIPWQPLEEIERNPVRSAGRWAREFDVLHLSFVAPRAPLARIAYASWPASVLYVAHTDYAPPSGSLPERIARAAADRVSMVRIDALAGVSLYTAEREARRFGVAKRRTHVLYNGVDTHRFHPPVDRSHSGPLRLLTVAHLVRQKQIDRVLRAVRVLDRDCKLTIAGDGPDLERLRAIAGEEGLGDRVQFIGLRNDVPELLREADIFVHTSMFEAFGLSIAEAMASGLAVVASRAGGVSELVEDGVSGLLVSPQDDDGLVRALRALVDQPSMRQTLGDRARDRVRQNFTVQQSAISHVAWCEAVSVEGLKARLRPWLRSGPEASVPIGGAPVAGNSARLPVTRPFERPEAPAERLSR